MSVPPEMTRSRRTLGVAAALFPITVLLDAALLRFVGLVWIDQLVFAVVVLVWAAAGAAMLYRIRDILPDRLTFYALAATLGMLVHAALCFVLFHTAVVEATGLYDFRAAAQAAFAILLLPALLGARPGFKAARGPWLATPKATAAIFALASVVAIVTAFGFFNNKDGQGRGQLRAWVASGTPLLEQRTAPNWGDPQDRPSQLFGGDLARRGFPDAYPFGAVSHRGVETTLTGIAYLSGRFFRVRWAAFSKPLCLLWLFVGSHWMFLIARERGLKEVPAVLATAGMLLYAALNLFAFRAPVSSYNIAPASGTLYHNVHQLASVAIGLAGLYLLTRDLRQESGLFAFGCTFLGASLFYKPSFFAMVVPGLALAVLIGRRFRSRDVLRGASVLLAGAALWYGYPWLLDLPMRWSVPLEVAFLPWQRGNASASVAWPVTSESALAISVLVLGYAALVVPALHAGWRLARRLRSQSLPALATTVPPATAVLLVAAAGGILSGLFLIAGDGNYMWGSAVGLFCLLPLLVDEIGRIAKRPLRRLAWTIYGAHLLSGAWNLWVFGYWGTF
jgi:hypothetical protein